MKTLRSIPSGFLLYGWCFWLAAWVRSASDPQFELQVVNDQTVVLSWQDLAPGYILQESDSPDSSVRWLGILQTPTTVGNRFQVTHNLSPGWTRKFYRVRAKGVFPGLDYLIATQNADGSWGSANRTPMRDSTAVIEALALYDLQNYYFFQGISGLMSLARRNHDDGARLAMALAQAGQNPQAILAELLTAQNVEVADPASLGFPGRGWGLAPGYGTTTLDTALVLRALKIGGRQGGLAVAKEQLAPSATSAAHAFSIPAGASGVFLKVRSVTGGTLRFSVSTPSSGTYSSDISPASTPIIIAGLPSTAGPWALQVQNLSAATASYTAEIAFTDAGGFDLFRLTTPLLYLGMTQNTDGGWGIGRGEDSQLMITAEVLMTLAAFGDGFVGPGVFSSGANWLTAHQNPDGGFSSVPGTSNGNETALAMNALRIINPAGSLASAVAFLKSAQLPDGSWGSNPYQTAAAVKALYLAPQVGTIPNQTVAAPAPFAPITLDNYVADPDHADNQLTWAVTGNTQLNVSIVNRIATITYPPATSVSEALQFTATDPDGFTGSATATFTVNYQLADYTIARGASATGSRSFSGASSVLDQISYYIDDPTGLPANVNYTTTSMARTSATVIKVGFQISVLPGATPGFYTFQVEYSLYDAGDNPLGPLTGNVFNFSIKITP